MESWRAQVTKSRDRCSLLLILKKQDSWAANAPKLVGVYTQPDYELKKLGKMGNRATNRHHEVFCSRRRASFPLLPLCTFCRPVPTSNCGDPLHRASGVLRFHSARRNRFLD